MRDYVQNKLDYSISSFSTVKVAVLSESEKETKQAYRWIIKGGSNIGANMRDIRTSFLKNELFALLKLVMVEAQKQDCRVRVYKSHILDPDLIIDFDPSCGFERGMNVGLPQTQKNHEHRVDMTQDVRCKTIGFPTKSERTCRKEVQRKNEQRVDSIMRARRARERARENPFFLYAVS